MRVIELSYQKNIRDLGGMVGFNNLKIKESRLIRGGYLGHLSTEDVEILNSLHITDVIDFRSEKEFTNRHDYVLDGVTYHNYPCINEKIKDKDQENADGNLLWFVDQRDGGFQHMSNIYREFVTENMSVTAYKNFFKLLLSKDDATFYFHCSQGKDRAGMAAYFLEIALGVSEEDALEDYLFTNVAMNIRIDHLLAQVKDKDFFDEEYERSMYAVFLAKEEYINATINAAKELYGSVLGYIKNALEVDIDKLRKMYLE